jgi:tetratricopeptide (TPR) repeat protein
MELINQKQLDAVLNLLEKFLATEEGKDAKALMELGEALLRAQAAAGAEKVFTRLIDLENTNGPAHNLLGIAKIMQGDGPGAEKALRGAVELLPQDRPSLNNLAKVLILKKDWGQALSYLDKAWQISGQSPNAPEIELINSCRSQLGQKPQNLPRDLSGQDPFLKLTPPEKHASKNGLNILIYADFNVAGQLTKLCRALNQYTPHKARCIIVQDDYLQYDRDIILRDQTGRQVVQDFSEIQELVKKADFFHIGRQAVNLPNLDFNRILNEKNCLVQYFGSHLRMNHKRLFLWHLKRNIAAVVGYGWTQAFPLHRKFYHIQQFFDPSPFKRVPRLKKGDTIRVVHAPTNREVKRTADFVAAMEPLVREFNVEMDIIEGVGNEACLARKAKGHITYDEMGTPTFGLNSVESMAIGHVALSSVNPHVLSYMPDTPVVRITQESLGPMLRRLVSDHELVNAIGDRSFEFVRNHYNEERSVTQFAHLYNGIKYGFFHCDSGLPLEFS